MQAAGYGSSARENSGLAIAAIISITLHALAAWGVYDLPLLLPLAREGSSSVPECDLVARTGNNRE